MDKIVLIYPAYLHEDPIHVILPLSLIYLATPLRNDFDVRIIDQRVDPQWRRTLERELQSGSLVCTGISSMTGPQILQALEAASIIRKVSPDVPIVWGGVHPSLTPEQTIKNDLVDIIVIGDGEETFRELVDVIRKGGNKEKIKGILYKDDGSIVRTPLRRQFPFSQTTTPAYELIDIKKYNFRPPWIQNKSLPVLTSRGCPMRCAYCYNTQFSQNKWTSLSPEQTFMLMANLVKEYGIRNLFLLDDNFFVSLKRVRRICELLIESDLDVGIHNANCRADTIVKMDDEFLKLLKRAGLHQMLIGVESGSNGVLDRINKNITVDQVLDADKKLKNAGIKPFYSFMAGFPFESTGDIKQTLSLMHCLLNSNQNAVVYKLQLYTPFPGTELYDDAARLGMKFPETLTEWATYHYDKLNYNGFNSPHRKFLLDMTYYTTFLDNKLSDGIDPHLRLISKVYSRILSFRIQRGFYACRYELYPLKMLKQIRSRPQNKNVS